MRQGYSTKPAELGVPKSAFAARNTVRNPFVDVANQHNGRPRNLPSQSGAKNTNVSPPPAKKQRLDYDQKQRPGQRKVQNSASNGAAGTVRPPDLGVKRKNDSTDVLTANDDDIKHDQPLSLHAQTERQTRIEPVGEDLGSEYGTEFETDKWVRCFSAKGLFTELCKAPCRTWNTKGLVKGRDRIKYFPLSYLVHGIFSVRPRLSGRSVLTIAL